ncbi:carboxylesterase family protein [Tistrella sp. BH-R2-4]|uniref:Carboxylesterase family protein n=1 Tax=Tistrella arctica TaxID=3133430 RepID=A0ABU9YK89_9PROT
MVEAAFARRFGAGAADALKAAAAHRAPASPLALLGDLEGDLLFTTPARAAARAHSDHGGRAYLYSFDWQSPRPDIGACHCLDLPFLFGIWDVIKRAPIMAGAATAEIAHLGHIFRMVGGIAPLLVLPLFLNILPRAVPEPAQRQAGSVGALFHGPLAMRTMLLWSFAFLNLPGRLYPGLLDSDPARRPRLSAADGTSWRRRLRDGRPDRQCRDHDPCRPRRDQPPADGLDGPRRGSGPDPQSDDHPERPDLPADRRPGRRADHRLRRTGGAGGLAIWR